MFVLLFIFLSIGMAMVIVGYSISGPRYQGPVSDHFDGTKFINPTGVKAKGFGEVFKWMLNRKRGEWSENRKAPAAVQLTDHVDHGIRITFINHSSFLIQVDGVNILTDPVFSQRTSPVEWAGPRRMRPPGVRLEDLPVIDVLLLSHNHWDHLDIRTVRSICLKDHPVVITPLGVSEFLEKQNLAGAIALDWWQEATINSTMSVQCVPAQHFSGRGMFDRDASLWCGYSIRRPRGNIYFAGDTGYNPETFKTIGERCSPIELALIPIGAFKPKWFMSPIHCSPEESVRIHQEVKARISIATHFGTFPLADDGQSEPVSELKRALQEAGVQAESFRVLTEGNPVQLQE